MIIWKKKLKEGQGTRRHLLSVPSTSKGHITHMERRALQPAGSIRSFARCSGWVHTSVSCPLPLPQMSSQRHIPPLPVRGLCWTHLPVSFVTEDLLTFLRHSRLHCWVDNVLVGAKCAVRVVGHLQNALSMGSCYSTGAVAAENLHSSFQRLLGINRLE